MVGADAANTCRLSISEQPAIVESEATEEEPAGPPNEDHFCLRCASQQAATLAYDLLLLLLLATRLMRDETLASAAGRSRWAPPRANRSISRAGFVFVSRLLVCWRLVNSKSQVVQASRACKPRGEAGAGPRAGLCTLVRHRTSLWRHKRQRGNNTQLVSGSFSQRKNSMEQRRPQ